jgi:hypothetical protein
VTQVSDFVARMQEALIRYERAKNNPDERSAARREMAELIKKNYHQEPFTKHDTEPA